MIMKNFTQKIIIVCVFIGLIALSYTSYTYSSGMGLAGNTNAPGESNCAGCHSGSSLQTNSSSIAMNFQSVSNIPNYKPDSNYTISVTLTQSGISKFGFQITALDSNNRRIGSFTAGTGTRLDSTQINGNFRQYLTHTATNGSGSRTWTFNWRAPRNLAGRATFYVIGNMTNNNGGNNGDVIHARTFVMQQDTLAPKPNFTFQPSSACVGDTIQFLGTATGPGTKTYDWTFSGGNPSTSKAQNPIVVFNQSGNRNVRLTVNNGFASASVNRNIQIFAQPDTIITISKGVLSFCEGDSVVLQAPLGQNYLWNTNETSREITVKQSGTYFVKVTGFGGCEKTSKSVVVNVKKAPIASVRTMMGGTSFCSTDSITLVASGGNQNYRFVHTVRGELQNSADSVYIIPINSILPLNGSNTVFVEVTNTEGCKATSPNLVFNYNRATQAPNIQCVSSTANSITVNLSNVANATDYELSLDSGANWTSTNNQNQFTFANLTPATGYNITARAKLSSGVCNYSLLRNINCNTSGCRNITADISFEDSVCQGTPTSISFSNFSIDEYKIKNINSNTFIDSVLSFTIAKDTTLRFELLDTLNPTCLGKNFEVTIVAIPIPDTLIVSISNPKDGYCVGDTVFFDVSETNGATLFNQVSDSLGNTIYVEQLSGNKGFIELTSDNINNFSVTAVNNKCAVSSAINTIKVGKELQPEIIESSRNADNVYKLVQPINYSKIRWYLRGNLNGYILKDDSLASETDSFFFDIEKLLGPLTGCGGVYADYTVSVEIENELGCVYKTDSNFFIAFTSVEEFNSQINLNIFPNPVENQLTIMNLEMESFDLEIINQQGKILYRDRVLGNNTNTIDMSAFSRGLLMIRFVSKDRTIVKKIIKR